MMTSALSKLRSRFWRHEAWVLRTAQQAPLLAILLFATTWVWLIPLALLLTPLTIFAVTIKGWTGGVLMALLGLLSFAALTPFSAWYFRWYFICVGLMFGRTGMARRKADELKARLAEVNS